MATLLRFAIASDRLLGPWTVPCDTSALQDRLQVMLSGYRCCRAPSPLHKEDLVGKFLRHSGVRTLMSTIEVAWTDGQVATALRPASMNDTPERASSLTQNR